MRRGTLPKLSALLLIVLLLLAVWDNPSAAVAGRTSATPTEVQRLPLAEQLQRVELVDQVGGANYAVVVQGDYAYLGIGPRLVILNVANPAEPVRVGQTAQGYSASRELAGCPPSDDRTRTVCR